MNLSSSNKKYVYLYLNIIVLLFHITRNISLFWYVLVLGGSYFLLYINFRHEITDGFIGLFSKKNAYKLIFLITLFWIPIISIPHTFFTEYTVALPRFLVTLPYIIFMLIFDKYNMKQIVWVLRILTVYMTLSSLSMPYQMIFGPVSYFADSSIRDGLIRYASLAGSLTALGTFGSYALAILMFSKNYLYSNIVKNIQILIITIGMLLSLQKAAVANLIILLVLYIVIKLRKDNKKLLYLIVLIVLSIFIMFLLNFDSKLVIYIKSIIIYTFSESTLSLFDDLMIRVWSLPAIVINANGIGLVDIVFGIGFKALAGTLGLPYYPMAHNNYFDFLFSGGIVHLIAFLYFLLRTPYLYISKVIRKIKINEFDSLYFVFFSLVIINMMIGASSIYQPVSAVFIFYFISSYSRVKDI